QLMTVEWNQLGEWLSPLLFARLVGRLLRSCAPPNSFVSPPPQRSHLFSPSPIRRRPPSRAPSTILATSPGIDGLRQGKNSAGLYRRRGCGWYGWISEFFSF